MKGKLPDGSTPSKKETFLLVILYGLRNYSAHRTLPSDAVRKYFDEIADVSCKACSCVWRSFIPVRFQKGDFELKLAPTLTSNSRYTTLILH